MICVIPVHQSICVHKSAVDCAEGNRDLGKLSFRSAGRRHPVTWSNERHIGLMGYSVQLQCKALCMLWFLHGHHMQPNAHGILTRQDCTL